MKINIKMRITTKIKIRKKMRINMKIKMKIKIKIGILIKYIFMIAYFIRKIAKLLYLIYQLEANMNQMSWTRNISDHHQRRH